MDPVVLALLTSYLDARQRRKEWPIPNTRGKLSLVVSNFYWRISPQSRSHALNGLDHRFTYATTRTTAVQS